MTSNVGCSLLLQVSIVTSALSKNTAVQANTKLQASHTLPSSCCTVGSYVAYTVSVTLLVNRISNHIPKNSNILFLLKAELASTSRHAPLSNVSGGGIWTLCNRTVINKISFCCPKIFRMATKLRDDEAPHSVVCEDVARKLSQLDMSPVLDQQPFYDELISKFAILIQ